MTLLLFLLFFLHILFAHPIVFCTSYCFFAHLIVLHFFYFIAHFTLISPFLTTCMPLCYVTLYNLYSYYFALSTERTWFDYISLLIIPCITIMWQIKKPWPWHHFAWLNYYIRLEVVMHTSITALSPNQISGFIPNFNGIFFVSCTLRTLETM